MSGNRTNMSRKYASAVIAFGILACLAACANFPRYDLDKAVYWQRADLKDVLGVPPMQQQKTLNNDIAGCVRDVRKLSRAENLRHGVPPDALENTKDEEILARWDALEHDGSLRAEHSDYHDFEACMLNRGWKRIRHAPYPEIEKSQKTYLKYRGADPDSGGAKDSSSKSQGGASGGGNSYFNL